MARNEQLIRQHKLLQILERSRFGRSLTEIRDDLVEELGLTSLHTRSVRRDLEALQAAGFDIASEEHQRGRIWKLGRSHRGMHKITASATELMALSLGRDLLLPLAGTPFWQGIETFWHKIQESLPEAVWKHYEKYRQVLFVLGTPAKSYEKQQGILKTINRAILEHRVVRIEYQSMAAPAATKRTIHPYAVALYQSSLYVIADACEADDESDRIRHLKLDRFRKATALDEWFRPRKDFDISKYLSESIGIFARGKPRNFRIRISPLAARWVQEDPWHPDQSIREQRDGSIILSVKAAHELEVIPRVLALGAEAELLSPASCRELMTKTISKLHRQYRK
jgi:predicted DNA-binding transcriptional regulator YafY